MLNNNNLIMEKKDFTIKNRYGMEHNFIHENDNIYIFKPLYNYCRLICNSLNKNEYDGVDPDGGPFIVVGCHMPNGLVVKRIYGENNEIKMEID